jgi:hypothetical protein
MKRSALALMTNIETVHLRVGVSQDNPLNFDAHSPGCTSKGAEHDIGLTVPGGLDVMVILPHEIKPFQRMSWPFEPLNFSV